MYSVAIALGSNIDPQAHLQAAAERLRARWPDMRFSAVYRTAAREVEDQEDFLNAVGIVETKDSPEEIVAYLQEIERALKKDPPYRYGPRTIDLDLLLYGELILPDNKSEQESYKLQATDYKLVLPHPRMHERRFVLKPLLDLVDARETHPSLHESWATLLAQTAEQRVDRIDVQL